MSYSIQINPKAYKLTVAAGSGFAANKLTFPGVALSLLIDGIQVTNNLQIRLNGDSACVFDLTPVSSFAWSYNDLHSTSIEFANTMSGAVDQHVTVIAGVASV